MSAAAAAAAVEDEEDWTAADAAEGSSALSRDVRERQFAVKGKSDNAEDTARQWLHKAGSTTADNKEGAAGSTRQVSLFDELKRQIAPQRQPSATPKAGLVPTVLSGGRGGSGSVPRIVPRGIMLGDRR